MYHLRMKIAIFISLIASNQALAVPNYSVDQNPMPGAQITTTYNNNAGGSGITPYYGYYVSEYPSLNDYGHIAGRTNIAHSPDPMIKGRTSGQAAVWKNGVVNSILFEGLYSCRDQNGDGIADASACGSRALAISNLGKVGGSSNVNMAGIDSYFEGTRSWWPNRAGEYDNSGGRELSNYAISQAQIQDVNNQSNIVGTGITNGGAGPQDGRVHGLVKINGDHNYIGIRNQESSAHALNEYNLVTGAIVWNESNDYSSGLPHSLKAYTWLAGELNVAPDGITDPAHLSEGFDVNDAGLVVGRMGWRNHIQAFKWSSPNGSLEGLGTLGGNQSVARSVNNAGQIVGWSNTSGSVKHAFIYENGVMYDLNDYANGTDGFVIVDAYSINEIGQVLVRARNELTNENQYWLLTNPDSLPSLPPELQPAAVDVVSMGAFGGAGSDQPIKIMADEKGNTISVGYYSWYSGGRWSSYGDKPVDFDPSSAEDLVTVGNGVYIQKLDKNSNYLWTKQLPAIRGSFSTYNRAKLTDLFVEPDGSFHIVGEVGRKHNLDLNPDADESKWVRGYRGYRDYYVSFRASYSSTGELVSSTLLRGELQGGARAVGVTVDDAKNIYVLYHKEEWGGIARSRQDIDFDPGESVANVQLYASRPAIVVTKTSRNALGTEQFEWAKSMSSVGMYQWQTKRYEDDYAWISGLSIAAPAVIGEGPMVAFSYRGAINFQVYDSNAGLLGNARIVDAGKVYRNGFIRMTESDEPSVIWMDSENQDNSDVKLVRNGNYFGMQYGSRGQHLIHGVAIEAGYNHIDRTLKGQNKGIALSQQGDVYTSGYINVGLVNFDAESYDVQGNTRSRSSFLTKINANGNYGWTFSHQGDGYSSLAVDHHENLTAVGTASRALTDQDGNIIRMRGNSDVLVTRMIPTENMGSHLSEEGAHAPAFAPDFSVRVAPYSKVVRVGDSTNYTVQLESFKGLTGVVALTFVTTDSSISGNFSSPSVNLVPDEITTTNLTISAAMNIQTGSYEFEVIASDGDGVIIKTALARLYIAQPPDLVIDALASPSEVRSGGEMTLSYTVMNQGSDDVNTPFTNKIYLSTDPNISTADLYLGQFDQFMSLAAGASDTASHVFTIPSNQAVGNYYIGVITDADASVTETNESNNSKGNALHIVASDVDAAITSVTSSVSNIVRGKTMRLNADLNNLGSNTITNETLVVNYYLSTDAVVTTQDTLLGSTTAATLVGGASSTVSIRPIIKVAAGTYYLGVIIDPDNQITETDENNNVALNTTPITITGNRDLTVSALSAPAQSGPAGSLTIQFTAENQGSVDASERIYYRIVLSDDAIITTNDLFLRKGTYSSSRFYIDPLAANSRRDITRTITLPASVTPGNYYLGVILDSNQFYSEFDESNNTRSQPLQVLASDILDVSLSNLSSSAMAINKGDALRLRVTLENTGTNRIYDTVTVNYYLSTDATITTEDYLVGSNSRAGLNAGDGYNSSYNSSAYAQTSVSFITTGDYYFGAIVDPNNTINESDESNNIMVSPTPITISDNRDLTISALSAPAQSGPVGDLAITFTASNLGPVDTNGRIYYRIVLSDDDIITVDDPSLNVNPRNSYYTLYNFTFDSLAANSSREITHTLPLPRNITLGNYYIGVIIDPQTYYNRQYRYTESDESNNTKSSPLEITAL